MSIEQSLNLIHKKIAEYSGSDSSLKIRLAMNDDCSSFSVGVNDADAILDETSTAVPETVNNTSRDPDDPWLARVSAAAFLARISSPEDLARRRSEITSILDLVLCYPSFDRNRFFRRFTPV